jgi:hypothetical protein
MPSRLSASLLTGRAPRLLHETFYDFCIHDVGPTMVYLPHVRARHMVLRLNDIPGGFSSLPGFLGAELEERLAGGRYGQVWAVSEPLAEYARRFTAPENVRLVPNGLDASGLEKRCGEPLRNRGKKCVYLGDGVPWLDVRFVLDVADLLPDWEFHFIGDGYGRWSGTKGNVRFLPPVDHARIGEVLAGYAVGLLPYRNLRGRMDYVRRPLKFYEYYAAGLGVAAIDVGGLRAGIGPHARYGDTPESFARAVEQSVGAAEAVDDGERRAFARGNDWSARIDDCVDLLRELDG